MTTVTERLFFALWPDPAVRARLTAAAGQALAGVRVRRIPPSNLHLTLAFLGAVDPAVRRRLEAEADRIGGEAFTLVFDRAGFWRGSGVCWLGTSRTPPALQALAAALVAVAAGCGIAIEPRPFRPHVTLARRAHGRRAPGVEPVVWPVSRFMLVRSRPTEHGSQYEIVRSWGLPPKA